MKFIDNDYFNDIVFEMAQVGFCLISRVQIDTGDVAYHVGASIARNTALFFGIKGKAFIVQMSYLEDNFYDEKSLRGYWRLATYFSLSDEYRPNARPLPETDIFDTKMIDDFKGGMLSSSPGEQEWHFEQEDKNKIEPEVLAGKIKGFADQFVDHLEPYFSELQVTSFPPYYTFPQCEKIFWQRFGGKGTFKGLVGHPWGSDFL